MSWAERRSMALMRWGLWGFGACLPWTIAGAQISLALVAIGVGVALYSGQRSSSEAFAPLGAYCLASLLSLAFHAGDLNAVQMLKVPLSLALLMVALRFVDPAHRGAAAAEKVLRCFLASAALASGYGVFQYFTGVDLLARFGLRQVNIQVAAPFVADRFAATGAFSRRLTFAHVLAMAIPAGVALSLAGGRQLLWALAALASAVGLAATYTRAAFFAVGAGIALILARSLSRLKLASAGAVLALGLGALALLPGMQARLASAFSTSDNADRAFIWARAAEVLEDHPVLGVGMGRYPAVAGPYYDSQDTAFPMRTWAHNTLLSTALETGILGLCAFLWMWLTLLAGPWRTLRTDAEPRERRLALAALGALVALLGIGLAHDYPVNAQIGYAGMLMAAVGLLPAARTWRSGAHG